MSDIKVAGSFIYIEGMRFRAIDAEGNLPRPDHARALALKVANLEQQLSDLRDVFKGMRHIDCRGRGGYHSIEHDEWLAALKEQDNG